VSSVMAFSPSRAVLAGGLDGSEINADNSASSA
jgi:hypothetical protein